MSLCCSGWIEDKCIGRGEVIVKSFAGSVVVVVVVLGGKDERKSGMRVCSG
jgi:hypothetical protein